jgi:hypothetical protein
MQRSGIPKTLVVALTRRERREYLLSRIKKQQKHMGLKM